LKASAGATRAKVVPAELLDQLLIAVHDPQALADLRLRGVSPSSAYCWFRKQGRLSKSSLRMVHLRGFRRSRRQEGEDCLTDCDDERTLVDFSG
jgi:hypothetical protein